MGIWLGMSVFSCAEVGFGTLPRKFRNQLGVLIWKIFWTLVSTSRRKYVHSKKVNFRSLASE